MITGVFVGRSGNTASLQPIVTPVVDPIGDMTVEEVMAIYGYLDEYIAARIAWETSPKEQIMATYGYLDDYQAALAAGLATSSEEATALNGYLDDYQAALATMQDFIAYLGDLSVEQLMAVYGYTETVATEPEAVSTATATSVEQVMGLYGYLEEYRAVQELKQDLTYLQNAQPVGQLMGIYGYLDAYWAGVMDEWDVDLGQGEMPVEQVMAIYPGFLESLRNAAAEEPGPDFWELEVVPPIYTYPWYIRP